MQRPGGADPLPRRSGAHPGGRAQPALRGRRGGAALGAGGAAGVHRREAAQPVGIELVAQPLHGHDLGGQQRVAELVEVVGGEPGGRGGQPLQPRRQPTLGAHGQPLHACGQPLWPCGQPLWPCGQPAQPRGRPSDAGF